ncbi:hypothetical protein I4U23_018710 [Adineta vaga]|nr:hypothetical protein I4U23_018710 [Adineta vaga]
MFASNLIADGNHASATDRNLDCYEIKNLKTNSQQSLYTTHTSPPLVAQSDPWPHQTRTHRSESTTSQAFIPSDQFDPTTWNFSSSNMNTNQCGNNFDNANESFGTDVILKQALPGTLATPNGWHSEIVGSSSSTFKNDFDSKLLNNTNGNVFEKHEEYKTLNTSDGPPVIFSSSSETNRFINELPSSASLTTATNFNNSAFAEYKNTHIDENYDHEQKTVLTEEQRAAIVNIDTQQPPPLIIRKKATDNAVTYEQNISVRYLQPPTPPPQGPIIIREIRPPPPCPKSPIHIRQRPAPSRTPPPIIFRERPPPRPPRPPSAVIERLLPPPPRPPRRLIVEQYGPCPSKPSDVFIERWLPYRRSDQRRIFYERVPTAYRPPSPNVLVMHGQAQARIHKEFINQGVSRVDPNYYLQHYGNELNATHLYSQYGHIIDEANRTVPRPPPPPLPPHPTVEFHTSQPPYPDSNQYSPYPNMNSHPPSSLISTIWERMKSAPPISPSAPYHPNYSSYGYSGQQYSPNNQWNSSHSYNNYPSYTGDHRTIPGVPSTWSAQNNSSSPYPYSSSSYQTTSTFSPTQTIQVKSDVELQNVLSNLTNGRVPTPLRAH